MWEALFLIAATLIISVAMTPKLKPPRPAAFDEFDFPQSDEGSPQAVYFGECWSTDWMVLAVGNYRTTPITKKGSKK